MRKKLLELSALLCLGISNVNAETRIMVISDAHVLSPENCVKMGKLDDNKLNYHSFDIFNKAVENVITAKPDLLLYAGDLSYLGEKSSHLAAHSILEKVKDAGIPVKVIPGNHDILVPSTMCVDSTNITAEEFASIYQDMGYEEGVARDSNSLSWAASINDSLAIIGLDANIYDGKEYYSDGCLRKSTLDWMKEQASAFQNEGKMVIAMVHEELMDHVEMSVTLMGFPITVNQSTALPKTILNINHKHNPSATEGVDTTDVTLEDVQTAFADANIHYVLTGHFHVHNTAKKTVKKSDGTDFDLYDISTGGLTTYPCWMRTLHINEGAETVESTSSLVMMTVEEGTSDLQSYAKEAIKLWDKTFESYKFSIAEKVDEYMAQENYELYDATEYVTNNSYGFPSVSYTRNFEDNDWHILYLPYNFEYSDLSENFDIAFNVEGKDSSLYFETFTETQKSIMPFTMALIRLKQGKEPGRYSIVTEDTNLQYDIVSDMFGELSVRGNYQNLTSKELEEGPYFILNDGKFRTVAPSADSDSILIKPMRWYIDGTQATNNPETISIYVDDENIITDTKISPATKRTEGKVFRINGSQVKNDENLPLGVYIVDGKKVIVKK